MVKYKMVQLKSSLSNVAVKSEHIDFEEGTAVRMFKKAGVLKIDKIKQKDSDSGPNPFVKCLNF